MWKLGNIFISDIIVCFVVSFWYTIWTIQDIYIFPVDHELSNGLSLSLGVIGITALSATQNVLTRNLRKKNKFVHFVCTRVLGLFWSICCIFHWRGLWNFLDKYNNSLFPFVLVCVSTFLLCILRSIRNILGPPFIIGFDGKKEYFAQPVIFSKIVSFFFNF